MPTVQLWGKETVPIEIKTGKPIESPINRNPEEIPISCYLEQGCILVVFDGTLGSVSIDLENLSTGESSSSVVPGTGATVVYFSGTPGTWTISFTLSSGEIYYGEFTI